MDTYKVHLHTITSSADWPSAALPIASHVSERLPQWATHGPHPPTAPFATYLVPQLKALATEVYSDTYASEISSPALLEELFDLVMSSCADLRTLSSRPSLQPKLTRTITFGLIASLFRSFAKELIPRKSAKFIRGGTMEFSLVQTLTNEDLAASEAKIWASLHPEQGHTFLDSDIKTEQAIDNGDASASSYHENLSHEAKQQEILRHRGSSWFDEPDIPEETEHSELSSQPSFASLEVPENARILEPLLRDYVDVPVVCVAEAKVMPSVMSKLLYQRNIWGLSEPVLGFIISDDGLVVRLAIGWTEIHEGKNSAHMATSSANSVEEGLGAYHLANPLACMSFARFILGLEVITHALSDTLFHQARDHISTSWNWSPDTTRSTLRGTSFIEQWRLQVADTLQLSVDCPPDSVSPPFTIAMADLPPRTSRSSAHDVPPTMQSSSRRTAPDTTAPSLPAPSPVTLAVPQHPQPSDDSQSQTSSVSRLPNSRRCGISDITDSPGGSIIEGLIDRDVYIVPYIIADQSTVAGAVQFYFRQIEDMVSTYDKDTSFHWAESWKQEADFPDFGSRFTKYWTELLDYAKSIPLKAFLRKEEAHALSNRLPTILESCELARIRDRLGLMMGANEAERRQAWDQFFTRTFLSMDITTINILFERRMNLSVNPYYKRIIENDLLTITDLNRHYDRLRIVQLIYSSAEQSLLARPSSPQQQAQLETATDYIRYLMSRVAKLLSEPPDFAASSFREILRQRCAVESLVGICDTLLVVPCQGAGRQMHETLFNTLCQSAGPNADRAKIFEQSVAMLEDFQLFLSPAPDPPPESPQVLALRNTKNAHPSPDLIPPKQKASVNLKAPSAHPLGIWPKVKLNNNFKGRVRAALNPFASDHSTVDGIPRLTHSASAQRQTSPKKPTSGGADSFESLLAQYYMSPKALHFGSDLILPLFLVEHKRFGDIYVHKASNQARLYAASALEFLQRIGAPKQPVYIFVTNGNQGALSMAMYGGPGKDSKPGRTLLMEWNVRVYDIGRLGDAYELSCFLQRLAHRAKELQTKFQQRLPAFLKEIKADPNILKWSMISYLPEHEKKKYRKKIVEEMQPPVEQPKDDVQDSESAAS